MNKSKSGAIGAGRLKRIVVDLNGEYNGYNVNKT